MPKSFGDWCVPTCPRLWKRGWFPLVLCEPRVKPLKVVPRASHGEEHFGKLVSKGCRRLGAEHKVLPPPASLPHAVGSPDGELIVDHAYLESIVPRRVLRVHGLRQDVEAFARKGHHLGPGVFPLPDVDVKVSRRQLLGERRSWVCQRGVVHRGQQRRVAPEVYTCSGHDMNQRISFRDSVSKIEVLREDERNIRCRSSVKMTVATQERMCTYHEKRSSKWRC